MSVILGLDVGGTKLAAGLVRDDGSLIAHEMRPTIAHGSAQALWEDVEDLINTVLASADEDYSAVGIGCGGPMVWPEGRVSPVNIPAWRDFPLKEHMRERFAGTRPIAIHNDAVALALAEYRWGAGRGTDNMLGMVVSTGVGGGLILNGRRIDGHSGNAGHVGHIVAEHDGPLCICGGRGCVERIARGPSIVAYAVELGWVGEQTGRALADGARNGDEAARQAFERAGRAVGVAIASMASALDLELVVIGGGIAQSGDVFFTPLHAAFDEHAGMAFVRDCRIVPAQLGYLAGISGAAAVVMDELERSSS